MSPQNGNTAVFIGLNHDGENGDFRGGFSCFVLYLSSEGSSEDGFFFFFGFFGGFGGWASR